jgi:HEAT repeat protein
MLSILIICTLLMSGWRGQQSELTGLDLRTDEIHHLIRQWYPSEAIRFNHFQQLRDVQLRLLRIAKQSSRSRDAVIDELLRVLAEPDVKAYHNYYLLWYLVCDSLGELRANQAIQTLIEALDKTDGLESFSVDSRPVVLGLIKIGEPAVPELCRVLTALNSPSIARIHAAEALFNIGGSVATAALSRALETETDEAVRNLIAHYVNAK